MRVGPVELGRDSDGWVEESGTIVNYWNNGRLLHRERVFLHVAVKEAVPLYCYRLDCREAFSGFPVMYLLFLLFGCLFVWFICFCLSHKNMIIELPCSVL